MKNCEFLYLILDESQFIKNPNSKTYKAILKLNSEYKLVLTGNPIENSLLDLWSQMNFLNKNMLGSQEFFKQNFQIPIEKNNDIIKNEKLKKLINPFILRRKKEDVAKDLPSLTEQTLYCRMSPEQAEIYEKEKSKIRNFILEQFGQSRTKNVSIYIIQALTKLRQIANHPRLTDENYEGESGKFRDIIRDIENIISEKHKILIFSSFVKHLNLFADYFVENDIEYSMLTGKTTNREKVVADAKELAESKLEARRAELASEYVEFEKSLASSRDELTTELMTQVPVFKQAVEAKFSQI